MYAICPGGWSIQGHEVWTQGGAFEHHFSPGGWTFNQLKNSKSLNPERFTSGGRGRGVGEGKSKVTFWLMHKLYMINIPSLKRSPWAWVFLTLSDPARSTRWNFAFLNSLLKKKEYRVHVDSLPFLLYKTYQSRCVTFCIFVCVWLHELSVMQTHSQLYYNYFLIFDKFFISDNECHHQSPIFLCGFHVVFTAYM